MSEEKLASHKLDIEGAQRSSADDKGQEPKESYRTISEDIGLSHVTEETVKNSNMVRENGDSVQDGADEKMLGGDDKESLALKNVEVKFIAADQNQNGDAKIDIGNVEKTFTGMTKEELMKYANDPFWVRLRWVLFVFFWALWIAMLVGAIAIIVYAPKCAAPTPLVWWKKGPLITVTGDEDAAKIKEMKDFNVQGVVYELSPEETYFTDSIIVENKIKDIVKKFQSDNIRVVLDLTANYVTENDELFKLAKAADPDALSAFVTTDDISNNNWKKVGSAEKAWIQLGRKYFLSQFNNNYDLQFTSPVAQKKLIGVLTHLTGLGISGFRLANAKHLIINSELKPETHEDSSHSHNLDQYGFYTHGQTIYQKGLGDLIHNFSRAVHNATEGEGFLTIKDDSALHAGVLVVDKTKFYGFDLPHFKFLNKFLQSSDASVPMKLFNSFKMLNETIDMMNLWMQVTYKPENFKEGTGLDASAYNMFMSLLPGVQIVPLDALSYAENKTDLNKKLEEARDSPVFQHGNFDFLLSHNDTAFAYTRIKPGNPGYFVALNPTDTDMKANFTNEVVGSELSVFLLSDGFAKMPKDNQPKKVQAAMVPLAKHSVAIFTFVPKS